MSRSDQSGQRRNQPDRHPTDAAEPQPSVRQRPTKTEQERRQRFRIAAVLLAVLCCLVLVALLSYTNHDADNAQLTIRDILGVIRGDEAMRVRFDTTHNWLGLLGAVISHWLFHNTVGRFAIVFPVIVGYWCLDVYRYQRLTPPVVQRSTSTIFAAILLSAFVGILQQTVAFSWIDATWSGAIGQFLSGVLVQFIGTIGALVIVLAAMGFLAVFGFGVDPSKAAVHARLGLARFRDSIGTFITSRRTQSNTEDPSVGGPATIDDEPQFVNTNEAEELPVRSSRSAPSRPVDEPAEMIRPALQAQPLASGVRIIRAMPKSTTQHQPESDESSEAAKPVTRQVDLDDVQRRLEALHPNRSIDVRRGRSIPKPDPEEYDDPAALRRGLNVEHHVQEDAEATDELADWDLNENEATAESDAVDVTQPRLQATSVNDDILPSEDEPPTIQPPVPSRPAAVIQRPLTVTVEQGPAPEPEVALQSTFLYDESIVYKTPTDALLMQGSDDTGIDDAELQNNARILQEKLETFRIRIENLTVQPGPVVTQYEFVPAAGIKVSQIESLGDDIALALKAPGVRIIAPIPGRGTVGIEIPNHNPALVRFSSIIRSPKYHNPDIKLPIAMGKTVVGEVLCADLAKMPHLLIAGATGKGKSVGINTIIMSLLYRMHPRDLKFVIVDPKRVEMTLYNALKHHFLAVSPDVEETIITEPQNAVTVLKAVVEEMQQRYSILAAAGQRNIADYNTKALAGTLKDKGGYQHRPMPYIVVIIDELADLMMTASKEVEEPIVRLAQLARAVGIHCVVATQRPSVDVVTGLIKANFPARIAYQVASRIDSRTILDASGAEHLIGNGDMLFNPGNMTKPLRMQNAFVSTEEVEAVCEWIGDQQGYSSPYMLPSVNQKRAGGGGGGGGDRDVLFEDAARIFIQLQQASVSTLQRRLKIGYARAARVVDELEMAGIVGPPDGSKGRQVLLQSEAELEAYL